VKTTWGVALVLSACTPTPAEVPPSLPQAQPAPSVAAPVPAPAPTPSDAVWDALTRHEAVLRRSDLDRFCGSDRFGHFLPGVDAMTDGRARALETRGCGSIPPAEIRYPTSDGSPPKLAYGLPYCCPPALSGALAPHTGGLKSCEEVMLEVTSGAMKIAGGNREVTANQYGAVLNRGSYFKHCGVPDDSRIHICSVIHRGQLLGLTVRTLPAAPAHADCIAAGVRTLSFPDGAGVDISQTTF